MRLTGFERVKRDVLTRAVRRRGGDVPLGDLAAQFARAAGNCGVFFQVVCDVLDLAAHGRGLEVVDQDGALGVRLSPPRPRVPIAESALEAAWERRRAP